MQMCTVPLEELCGVQYDRRYEYMMSTLTLYYPCSAVSLCSDLWFDVLFETFTISVMEWCGMYCRIHPCRMGM